jgi:2-haloacid dehalogenase
VSPDSDLDLDPESISTVTLDSYSTLVDVDTSDALAGLVADPEGVSRTWRARSLQHAMVATFLDAYRPFEALLAGSLAGALAAHGESLTAAERRTVLDSYRDLDVFGDVSESVARLAERYDCYVVSNGDPDLLDSMIESAGIAEHLAGVVSADEVESYKPHPAIYRHAAARAGTPAGEIAHVTAGWFDALGAANAGMRGVWVNRKDRAQEPFHPDLAPDAEVASLADLAADLLEPE